MTLPHVPPTTLRRRLQESDQLDVTAVGETDQRVMRHAIGMGTALLHGETERSEIFNGLRQVVDANHDVIE